MTPKEKATELADKFLAHSLKMSDHSVIYYSTAKTHALIAVDEILSAQHTVYDKVSGYIYNGHYFDEFWNEVKKEIENL